MKMHGPKWLGLHTGEHSRDELNLCDTHLTSMPSITPSEPILSEAANLGFSLRNFNQRQTGGLTYTAALLTVRTGFQSP